MKVFFVFVPQRELVFVAVDVRNLGIKIRSATDDSEKIWWLRVNILSVAGYCDEILSVDHSLDIKRQLEEPEYLRWRSVLFQGLRGKWFRSIIAGANTSSYRMKSCWAGKLAKDGVSGSGGSGVDSEQICSCSHDVS